ncbi:hypothetical protein KAR91_53050 [Candidatus Pacearchaeota archaeon]|nr:hypothetical protein [Candidatus Pacearchaeota archaeon]
MSDNEHPYNQIEMDKLGAINKQIGTMRRMYGLSYEDCRQIIRVGYELGWDGALDTEGATKFHRLTK